MTDRWIDLEGVDNMRDVGGLPAANGDVVASGVLIRSDNLQALSTHAAAWLVDSLGVTDVIDLRSSAERELEGATALQGHAGVRHHHYPLLIEASSDGDGSPSLPWSEHVGPRDDDFWGQHYLGYLRDRPDSVSAALRAISTASGAAVVHCAAGKDRTGTVVALALDVAGVGRAEIIADYLLTEQRLDRVLTRLSRRAAYGPALAAQTRVDQVPRAAALDGALEHLEVRFGGAAGWLAVEAGWSHTDVARLRSRLTSAR